jgi:hypothetical protein
MRRKKEKTGNGKYKCCRASFTKHCVFGRIDRKEESKEQKGTDMDELALVQFTGQLKKMRMVSNNLCYGPAPEPEDEIEQHLTLFSDGRVFFTGYQFSESGTGKYQRKRTKNFKINPTRAAYLLGNVGLYFSEYQELIFVTDIGTWTVELTNTNDKVFEYSGSLCMDLVVEDNGLSDLLRKYLEMPDLIGFDDDLRISRIIADDEYIVVGVSFGNNSRSYCYLCDDATVREGDTVVVPVGGDEELKCVVVKSVDVVTKDTAPFPIEHCKKVIEVIPEERILG